MLTESAVVDETMLLLLLLGETDVSGSGQLNAVEEKDALVEVAARVVVVESGVVLGLAESLDDSALLDVDATILDAAMLLESGNSVVGPLAVFVLKAYVSVRLTYTAGEEAVSDTRELGEFAGTDVLVPNDNVVLP